VSSFTVFTIYHILSYDLMEQNSLNASNRSANHDLLRLLWSLMVH